MQIFIIGTPYETAECLDKKRFNKQIIECRQILSTLEGKSSTWKNHPCAKQYKGHEEWLYRYLDTFIEFNVSRENSRLVSQKASMYTPEFHVKEYFDQMKRRLYTKDPEHYQKFSKYGTSDVNWYWNEKTQSFVKYENGKKLLD